MRLGRARGRVLCQRSTGRQIARALEGACRGRRIVELVCQHPTELEGGDGRPRIAGKLGEDRGEGCDGVGGPAGQTGGIGDREQRRYRLFGRRGPVRARGGEASMFRPSRRSLGGGRGICRGRRCGLGCRERRCGLGCHGRRRGVGRRRRRGRGARRTRNVRGYRSPAPTEELAGVRKREAGPSDEQQHQPHDGHAPPPSPATDGFPQPPLDPRGQGRRPAHRQRVDHLAPLRCRRHSSPSAGPKIGLRSSSAPAMRRLAVAIEQPQSSATVSSGSSCRWRNTQATRSRGGTRSRVE